MSFTILKSDGSTLAILTGNSVDTTSSDVTLHGQGFLTYGNALNENFVHMLENFASATPPANPMLGQIWADKTGSPEVTGLKYYVGGSPEWADILTTAAGTAGFVNTTGDTMTGTLNINSATALTTTGNVDVTGTTDLHGDLSLDNGDTFSIGNEMTLTASGPGGSPEQRVTLTSLTYGIELDAYNDCALAFNRSGSSYHFRVINSDTDTTMLRVDTLGDVFTYGRKIEIGEEATVDQDSYIDFHAAQGTGGASHLDWSTRIIRNDGPSGIFQIAQRGGALQIETQTNHDIILQRNGAPKITISTSVTDMGTNRIINLDTALNASNAPRLDQTVGNVNTQWVSYGIPGTRTTGMNYHNNTDTPRAVSVELSQPTGSGGDATVYVDNVPSPVVALAYIWGTYNGKQMFFIVPPGHYYRVDRTGNMNLIKWVELV